jgi:serine/threonine protein kinase/tetratricopeptide (TPR) repeat protein
MTNGNASSSEGSDANQRSEGPRDPLPQHYPEANDIDAMSDEELLDFLERSESSPDAKNLAREGFEMLKRISDSQSGMAPALPAVKQILGPSLAAELHHKLSQEWKARPIPGNVLGNRYRLIESIGEGGMGEVWLGEDLATSGQRVAIKLIKPGMSSQRVLDRFEIERQALAAMDHPNIARILDGGLSDANLPYFVMEYVRGLSLTDYCDRERLGIRDRLELFTQIAQGVQHAHQKGLIHRDLKPTNILIAQVDGQPVPKIIDFGLAKAIGTDLRQASMTQFGSIVGTLEYMAPEQAGTSHHDIDTRADIYSLGVILYELLTGMRPFGERQMQQAALDEVLRMIKEVEPERPSLRFSSSDIAPSCAALRQTEPAKLSRLLRSDLDWIVMKSLEKDRNRRYESASGFALDVRRYLDGEQVLAHPPSPLYRMSKWISRNRGLTAAVCVIGVSIGAGLIATLWQANRANLEAKRADERALAAAEAERKQRLLAASETELRFEAQVQREAAEKAADAERTRAAELQKIASFQANMLADFDSGKAGRDLQENLEQRLEAALKQQGMDPQIVNERLSQFRRELGLLNTTDAAIRMIDVNILQSAVKELETKFEDQPEVTATLRQGLALVYRNLGKYEAAIPLQRSALEIRQRELGDDHRSTITSLDELGLLLQYAGKLSESEPLALKSLESKRRLFGDEAHGTLIAENNVGLLLLAQGKPEKAKPFFESAVAKARISLGDDHADTLSFIGNLGLAWMDLKQPESAEPFAREALDRRRRVLGEEHQATLLSINNYALVVRSLNRLEEAKSLYEECLTKSPKVLGEKHPQTIAAIHNVGFILTAMKRYADAEPYCRQSMEKHTELLGPDHPSSIQATNNFAGVLQNLNRIDEAATLRRETYERSVRVLGSDHSLTLLSTSNYASLLEIQKQIERALELRRAAWEGNQRKWGESHIESRLAQMEYGNSLRVAANYALADTMLRQSVEGIESLRGPKHRQTATARSRWAQCLLAQQKFDQAEVELLSAEEIFATDPTVTVERHLQNIQLLIDLYDQWSAAVVGDALVRCEKEKSRWETKRDALRPQ